MCIGFSFKCFGFFGGGWWWFFFFFLEGTWSKSSCFLPKLVAYKTIEIKLETK